MHQAVRDLLEENDGRPVTVGEVAARSGVHPTSIYRRWGSPRGLLLDVAVDALGQGTPLPQGDDLGANLRTYAHGLVTALREPHGLAFLTAIMAAAADPDVGVDGARALLEPRLAQFRQMLDAAGPAGATLTPVDLIDGLLAPLYLRALLNSPVVVDDDDVERLVVNLLAVGRARAG